MAFAKIKKLLYIDNTGDKMRSGWKFYKMRAI